MLIAVPLALLAACDSGSDTPAAAPDNAANAAAPEAAANASMSAANSTAAMDPARAGEIQECIADVRPEMPANTDLDAFCGCAVDRMRGMGEEERPAMEACAEQFGIQPRN
jgi:hypothetical protein